MGPADFAGFDHQTARPDAGVAMAEIATLTPKASKRQPFSQRTQKSILRSLRERAEAGSIEAAEALIRLGISRTTKRPTGDFS